MPLHRLDNDARSPATTRRARSTTAATTATTATPATTARSSKAQRPASAFEHATQTAKTTGAKGATKKHDVSADPKRLDDVQRAVIADVAAHAKKLSDKAWPKLVARMKALGKTEADLKKMIERVRTAPLTVNFNPDKELTPAEGKKPAERVIDGYLADDHYRNCFETGITDGTRYEDQLKNYPQQRLEWEATLFRDRYPTDPIERSQRPKYAAVNSSLKKHGAAPGYGRCSFVLKEGCRERSTITPIDGSFCKANDVGNFKDFNHVLLNMSDLDFWWLLVSSENPKGGFSVERNFIECQVHGPIEFAHDIAEIAVDEKYRNTPYEMKLVRFAEKCGGVPIKWYREDA